MALLFVGGAISFGSLTILVAIEKVAPKGTQSPRRWAL
jgi:predicted metal-binding membrane protein